MANRERIFSNPTQLNSLSVIPFLRTSRLGKFRLGGNITTHPENKRWENELNRYYYACGCEICAKGLIIGLLCGSIWASYSYFQEIWMSGTALVVTVSFAIGGVIAGKIIGLVRANEKLKKAIKEIQEQWRPEEQPKTEHWTCGYVMHFLSH